MGSHKRYRRNFLDNLGGFFDEELTKLANDEARKKGSSITGNKSEPLNTEWQQKLIAETYVDEDKEVPYHEPHQSNRHQIEDEIVAVKSKEAEKEHSGEGRLNDSFDITFSDESDHPVDDVCVLGNLNDSFVEMGTREVGMLLSY